jgi:hypothetical protein
MGHS